MAQRFTSAALAAFVAVLGAGAAQAVTADQVWTLWQKQYSGEGSAVAARSQTRQGDTLILRDVTLSTDTDTTHFDLSIAEIRLREIGDGQVEVTFSPEAHGTSRATPKEDAPVTMDMTWRQTGAVAVASGTAEALSYDVTAAQVALEMTEARPVIGAPTTPGTSDAPAQLTPDAARARIASTITARDISGKHLLTDGAHQTQQSQITMKSVQVDARGSGQGTDSESGFTLSGHLADLVMSGNNLLPKGAISADMATALAAGMQMNADMRYGAGDFTFAATSDEGPMTLKGSATDGNLTMSMTPQEMRYAGGNTGIALEMTSRKVPVPLSATLAASSFDLSGPLAKSDTPQPFAAKLGLVDLQLSDTVWKIVDQAGHLPHDPATVQLDVTGTARPLIDLFSVAGQTPDQAPDQTLPVAIDTLAINQLQARAAGAQLTGNGAMTFDNTQGFPVPDGAIDLSLNGGIKLLENLSAMGFVPRDQIMFARMLLGLYAVQAGDDQYTSKIQFQPTGEILANGQRIR